MPRNDPSGYVWLAASVRSMIERLMESSQRANELESSKVAAKLSDAALDLSKVYEELIKLASPTPAPKKRSSSATNSEGLPF